MRYCSSLTCSSHSTALPSSFSCTAMCTSAVVGVAPCQCFSPGGNHTTSPGPKFLDGAAPALGPTEAGGDDKRLPQRMGMPGRPRRRFERDACAAGHAHRFRRVEQRIDPHDAREPLGRGRAGRVAIRLG